MQHWRELQRQNAPVIISPLTLDQRDRIMGVLTRIAASDRYAHDVTVQHFVADMSVLLTAML